MFDLLGIPEEDQPQFLEWGKTLGLTISYSVAEHVGAIEAALNGLYAATRPAVRLTPPATRRRPHLPPGGRRRRRRPAHHPGTPVDDGRARRRRPGQHPQPARPGDGPLRPPPRPVGPPGLPAGSGHAGHGRGHADRPGRADRLAERPPRTSSGGTWRSRPAPASGSWSAPPTPTRRPSGRVPAASTSASPNGRRSWPSATASTTASARRWPGPRSPRPSPSWPPAALPGAGRLPGVPSGHLRLRRPDLAADSLPSARRLKSSTGDVTYQRIIGSGRVRWVTA